MKTTKKSESQSRRPFGDDIIINLRIKKKVAIGQGRPDFGEEARTKRSKCPGACWWCTRSNAFYMVGLSTRLEPRCCIKADEKRWS